METKTQSTSVETYDGTTDKATETVNVPNKDQCLTNKKIDAAYTQSDINVESSSNSQTQEGHASMKEFDITAVRFSMFGAGITSPNGQVPKMQGSLLDVYTWMNSPRLLQLTHELRRITNEEEQKNFKKEKLPYVTFAGQFRYRNAEGLIQLSGLGCFDFDNLTGKGDVEEVRRVLMNDSFFETELMFTSPRGNGVKWVTHFDLSRGDYAKWYIAVSNYLHTTYGLEADPLPKNIASACFLCFDSNLVINPIIAPY